MITCRDCVELLFDFTADQLPVDHREHVEQHLTICSCCVAYLESYRLTIQMARQLRSKHLPPNLARQLRAVLQAGQGIQTTQEQPGG